MTLCSMYQFQPLKNQVQSVMKLPAIFSFLTLPSTTCSYKNDTVHVKISAKPSMLGIVTRQSVFCGKGVKFPVLPKKSNSPWSFKKTLTSVHSFAMYHLEKPFLPLLTELFNSRLLNNPSSTAMYLLKISLNFSGFDSFGGFQISSILLALALTDWL